MLKNKRYPDLAIDEDQVDCLLDPERTLEAHGMVDDLEARVGLPAVQIARMRAMLPTLQQALATNFSAILRSWLTPAEMELAIARNRAEKHPGVCHSHDFCDANMAMMEAFERYGADAHNEAGMTLWNAAWDIAKASEFSTEVRRAAEVQP